MSVNVKNPLTAVRRFEKNEVRDVSEPVNDAIGTTTIMTHIAGQPDKYKRCWCIKDDQILDCVLFDTKDKEKNGRKILKFIRRWNENGDHE